MLYLCLCKGFILGPERNHARGGPALVILNEAPNAPPQQLLGALNGLRYAVGAILKPRIVHALVGQAYVLGQCFKEGGVAKAFMLLEHGRAG